MRDWSWVVSALCLFGCAGPHESAPVVKHAEAPARSSGPTFEDEVDFLRRWSPMVVVADEAGGRIAISPKYQGRVMTSAVAAGGASLGWINHAFLEAGKTGTPFDNYGGEDRFWLGPEGGQYGLYFAPGAPFTFAAWQTPPALNEGAWEAFATSPRSLGLRRSMRVTNHAGTSFEVAVDRTVTLLDRGEAAGHLGAALPPSVQLVAFETKNRITNAGRDAWTKEHGLVSVWILGMYAPSADTHVVIPFDPKAPGAVVNDRYFGKVPADRLAVHDGYLTFTCDGAHRSKIGLGPARARSVLGSYSPSKQLLTLVQYDKPEGAGDYVNSMWEEQKEPFAGDVVNSYNDGPTAPGKPSLGGFYEIETSSPAAALAPGASLLHVHRTFHLVGPAADLDAVSRRVLGVGLDAFSK